MPATSAPATSTAGGSKAPRSTLARRPDVDAVEPTRSSLGSVPSARTTTPCEARAVALVDGGPRHELSGLDRAGRDEPAVAEGVGREVVPGRRPEAHRLDDELVGVDAGAGGDRVACDVDLDRVVEPVDEGPDARRRAGDEHDADDEARIEPEGAPLASVRVDEPSASFRGGSGGRRDADLHRHPNPGGPCEVIHTCPRIRRRSIIGLMTTPGSGDEIGRFLTIADAAELLAVDVATVDELIRSGELPAIRVGTLGPVARRAHPARTLHRRPVRGSRAGSPLWNQGEFANVSELSGARGAPSRDPVD